MKVYKYVLDYESTRVFLSTSLKDANQLSEKLVETINLEIGSFFTLLPDGADLERLYEFESGGILPQNPKIVTYSKEGLSSSYSITPTIREALSEIISNIIQHRKSLFCVFDDIIRNPNEALSCRLSKNCKYVYGNEVYYILSEESASVKNIAIGLDYSDAFWHSLGIITNAKLSLDSCELTEEIFVKICLNVQMFFVGAYDGEGYVFWERNGSDLFGQYVQSPS